MHYRLLVVGGAFLVFACRSAPAPKPAAAPAPKSATAPAPEVAPTDSRQATPPDTTSPRGRPATPVRVAKKPAPKRVAKPAASPAKPTSTPPKKSTPADPKPADSEPVLTPATVTPAGTPKATPTSAPAANPPRPIKPASVRLGGAPAVQGGDATAVARVSRDSAGVVSESEVARRAIEVFGDSMTVPVAHDATTAPTDPDEEEVPTWDIDVASYETHARVERYVRMFSGPARERIIRQLERGSRYEPMIRAKFRQGGLPEDMYYLALVESGYNPHAYSRAAAVGMWQFMASTARGLGLRVDWWVDERRDPVRSTWAAVRFLRGLRAQFGSLYLAAAAYNGGPGRVARGLSRYADDLEGATGDDRFFALAEKGYLRSETREYVPQLIAAALIAKDPSRYGLKLNALPPFAYDSVRVGPQTPLAAVAAAAGTTVAVIQDLNPHILRGMTPPGGPFQVRIPPGRAEDFEGALAELDESELIAVKRVVVKKGESLTTIARRAGIRVRDLNAYNPRLARARERRAIPGQVLLVPTPAAAAAALSVPDPGIERHARASGRARIHTVRRGESLSDIADRNGTTVSTLMRLNRLKRPVIFPGQTLVVSGRRRR